MLNCLIIYLIYAYLLFKFITFIFLIKNFLKITTNYRGIYIIKDFIYKNEIINFLKFKEQKFIKNLNNTRRSKIKLYNFNNNKIIIKKYKSIFNVFNIINEFINLSNMYNNYKICPKPIFVYKDKFNFYLGYIYLEDEKCYNRLEKIASFMNQLHKLGYTYSDVKEKHFIFNNNKIYLIDLDHHLKKIFFFANLKKELNILHCIERMPKLKNYFGDVSISSLIIFNILNTLKKIFYYFKSLFYK